MTEQNERAARVWQEALDSWDDAPPVGNQAEQAAAAVIAREFEALEAENARLREALGEICRDSNPDWTEKRVYPIDVLDDIHKIAVEAYYFRAALKDTRHDADA